MDRSWLGAIRPCSFDRFRHDDGVNGRGEILLVPIVGWVRRTLAPLTMRVPVAVQAKIKTEQRERKRGRPKANLRRSAVVHSGVLPGHTSLRIRTA